MQLVSVSDHLDFWAMSFLSFLGFPHGFLLHLIVAQRHQPQMSYLSVPPVPEPPSYLRPLLRAAPAAAPAAGACYEACFVAHVDGVVRSAAARAWAKLDANSDGQLDLEEQVLSTGNSETPQLPAICKSVV